MNTGATEEATAWRSILFGALSVGLAVALIAKAVDAHGRNAGLHRRLKAIERELEREQRDESRMRAELRALKDDPLYLESMLDPSPAVRRTGPVIERSDPATAAPR